MNCPKCGRAVISRYKFCGFCGANIHEIPNESSEIDEELNNNQIEDEPVIIVSKPKEDEEVNNEVDDNSLVEEDTSFNNESNNIEAENIEIDNSSEVEREDENEDTFEEVEVLEEPINDNVESTDNFEEVKPLEQEKVFETSEESNYDEEKIETVESTNTVNESENAESIEAKEEIADAEEAKENKTQDEVTPVVSETSEDKEEIIPVVVPDANKESWVSLNGRKIVRLLSTIAFLLAFAAVVIIIAKDYKSVIDDTKDIYNTFKGSDVKLYYQITTYLCRLFVPAILVVSGLMLVIGLFKGLVSYKKDTINESTTITHITYSVPVAFAFVATLLYKGVYDKNYIDISFYMSCGALLIIAISSIVEAIRQASFAETKAIAIFKCLFDFISSAALITAVILLMKDFFIIKYGDTIIGGFKISQIDLLTMSSYGGANNELSIFLVSLVFTLLFTSFVISISNQIGKKISMENGDRKIPYMPALLFILILVSFDIYSYLYEKIGYSLFADKILYYVILALAISSLIYMFRQILFDIEDKKNKNLILKRLGATLMFAISIAMILSYTIDGFSNQRLYFYNIISNIKSIKTIHVVIMQIMTVLMFILGVRKILSSFEKTDVEEAHTNAAHGVSLVFAAFFVSTFFKFVDAYETNEPKIESSEILCFIIYGVFAVLMVIFALLQYKKNVKQLICSIIEVSAVGVAIVLIYMFKYNVLGHYVGLMILSSISDYHITTIAVSVISLVLIILLSEKLKNLLTLNESKKSYAGIIFLALLLYVICVAALFVDIYGKNVMTDFSICFKIFRKCIDKIDYVPAGILFAEMILAPIFKQINKTSKQ